MSSVFRLGHYLKITEAIVRGIAVFVVDDFLPGERPTYKLFRDYPVFQYV